MTFSAYETSQAQGQPILLLDFVVLGVHWQYTTADRAIVNGGITWQPASISIGNIKAGSEIKQQQITVTAPRDLLAAQQFYIYPPSTPMMLYVWALHYDDPDQQAVLQWVGRVMYPTWKGSSVEITCEPSYSSVQTTGLRRRYSITCAHVLYGNGCNLTPASFAASATLTAVSGFTLTATAFGAQPADYYSGGYIEWASSAGYTERRAITAHSGNTVTINYGAPDLGVGSAVTVYPGCDHTMGTCQSKFSNLANYGGTPYIPSINPLGGAQIF